MDNYYGGGMAYGSSSGGIDWGQIGGYGWDAATCILYPSRCRSPAPGGGQTWGQPVGAVPGAPLFQPQVSVGVGVPSWVWIAAAAAVLFLLLR